MPTRVHWDPAYEAGHAPIDGQHRELLAQCDGLAGLCAAGTLIVTGLMKALGWL